MTPATSASLPVLTRDLPPGSDSARSAGWQRVFHGVYVPVTAVVDHRLKCRAALLTVPPGSLIAGRSAAALYGVAAAVRAGDPVELMVPSGTSARGRRGILLRRCAVPDDERSVRAGLPVTSPLRTAWDVAAGPMVDEAVVVVDAMLRARRVSAAELSAYAVSVSRPGSVRARRAVALADGRAESPQESRLRVILRRAGLRPEPQHDVFDRDGIFVARVDLAFVDQRVAVEYEGAHHAHQVSADRDRLNRLDALGWRVVFVTARDIPRPEVIVDRVRGALFRSRPR